MAKYTGPKAKLCRRFGENIYGPQKYDKILSKRKFPPGQHGSSMHRKPSDYSLHLNEKQKLRYTYCLLERQFRRYFQIADKMQGITGYNLLKLLERRLYNTVYRMGFATTRMQARQFVNHGHFMVNGKKVDIPSYLLKPGDIIEVRPKSRGIKPLVEAWNNSEASSPYPWLTVDKENMRGQFVNIPNIEDIPTTVDMRLVVEYYSK